ncbi:MAG: type VI secretion system baseplate subunit TssK [Isosphaeraceae bacterium]
MDQNAIDWHEGMFLRPQHFQTQERFRRRMLRLTIDSFVPYNWGFARLDIDTEALSAGRLSVTSVLARFPSGTLVETPEMAVLKPLAIRPLIGSSGEVNVYLAVPDMSNFSEISDAKRFEFHEMMIPDEHDGALAPVRVRRLLPVLLPEQQLSDGYESVLIAKLRRSSQSAEGVELVPTFIPSLLRCQASPLLSHRVIESLSDTIRRKLGAITPGFDTESAAGMRRFFSDPVLVTRLSLLNQAHAVLSALSGTLQQHPLAAYRDLCDIIGRLAILGVGSNRQVGELPEYDHENLGPLFFALKRRIESLVEVLEDPGYKERAFVGVASRMQVRLDSEWLEPDWQLLIGIRSNLKPADAVKLFSANGPMDFKISSSERVDKLYRMGERGLHFKSSAEVPDVLGEIPDTVFLTVGRDEGSGEWTYVRRNQTLALRFNEGLLTGSIHDQTRLQLRFDGNPVEMELTLYAIPPGESMASGRYQEETGSGSA